MTRDFIHVDDVVGALRWALESDGVMPQTLNVGTGRRTSLRTLVELLAAAAGLQPAVTCSGRFRAGDVRHAVADTSACARGFGAWQPRSLETAIPNFIEWLIDAPAASAYR
jgi:dTDP-L-rhamnose 4-epimerase